MPGLTPTTEQSSFTRSAPENVTFAFSTTVPEGSKTPNPAASYITFRPGSSLTTGRHWHITHTEHLQVKHGAALITVHNTSRIYTPADGIVTVPRKARHEWARWDCPGRKGHQLTAQETFRRKLRDESARGEREEGDSNVGEDELKRYEAEDLQVVEWTDPTDGEKEIFFRNLFSVLQESVWEKKYGTFVGGGVVKTLHLFTVMKELDNMLVLLDLGVVDEEGVDGGWWNWGKAKVEEGIMEVVMGGAAVVGGWVFGLKAVNVEYTPRRLLEMWERNHGEKSKGT